MRKRELLKTMKERGWTYTVTGRNHLKFVHRKTGHILFHGGTPSDWRSQKNLLAHASRIESEITQ